MRRKKRRVSYIGKFVSIRQYGDDATFTAKFLETFKIYGNLMVRLEAQDGVTFDIAFDSIQSIAVKRSKNARILAFRNKAGFKLRLVKA